MRKSITGRREKEEAIKKLINEHLSHLPPVPDELPVWPNEIDDMAEFLSMARAALRRDEQGEPYTVDPEDPDRATYQLNCLGLALARLYVRPEIGDHELDLLWRVIFASVPAERLLVLSALVEGLLNAEQVASATGLSRSMIYKTLKPLHWADLVDMDSATPCKYRLSANFDAVASKLAMVAALAIS
jgi:hypothetical protein